MHLQVRDLFRLLEILQESLGYFVTRAREEFSVELQEKQLSTQFPDLIALSEWKEFETGISKGFVHNLIYKDLISDYEKGRFVVQKGKGCKVFIKYNELLKVIEEMKKQ